jgi:hypothetical protein
MRILIAYRGGSSASAQARRCCCRNTGEGKNSLLVLCHFDTIGDYCSVMGGSFSVFGADLIEITCLDIEIMKRY